MEYLVGPWLAERGITARFEDVIITTGSQQGLDLAGRVLIDPGDVVLVELPTYSGAIAAFHNLQASLVGVPQDAEGIDIAALDRLVARLAAEGRRVKFVYVTPNFQNPAGLLMSAARRRALLDAAARHDLVILEDDPVRHDLLRGHDPRGGDAADQGRRCRRPGDLPGQHVEDPRARGSAWRGWSRRARLRRRWNWPSRPRTCAAASSTSASCTRPSTGVSCSASHRSCGAHYQEKRTVMERALTATLDGRVQLDLTARRLLPVD